MELTARIGEYYKTKEHNYSGFFKKCNEGNEVIDALIKQQKELTAKIAETNDSLAKEYSKRYAMQYEKPTQKIILRYTNPRTSVKNYFSVPDGQGVTLEMFENPMIMELPTKSGEIEVLAGYNYNLCAIITKKYKYSINLDCSNCRLILLGEVLRGFFENEQYSVDSQGNLKEEIWDFLNYYSPMYYIDSSEFISNLYGRNLDTQKSLHSMRYRFKENKSTEIILRTAPEKLINTLLECNINNAMPVHKILEVEKDIYDQFVAKGYEKELLSLKEYLRDKTTFNKTNAEWLELVEECKKHEKELKFYQIDFSNSYYSRDGVNLLETLAEQYKGRSNFKNNYSFSKFIKYVVEQTIQQGFARIRDYCDELNDYLSMCTKYNSRPNYYTDRLKMVHDISLRNQKFTVSPEEENIFRSHYLGMADEKVGDYFIVPPKNSEDIRKEGNALAHCVGSYVKKVIDGECLIIFLRKDKDQPLVTVEIEDGKICQARGANNRNVDPEEAKAIEIYANKHNYELAY